MGDLVLTGGVLHTMDPARPRASALWVRDGRIAAVGDDDEVRRAAGGATEVGLGGRSLVPGFQDAHVHPPQGGRQLTQCALFDLHDRDAYLAAIATYVASHPDEPWIIGGGWAMDVFPGGTPSRRELDAVTGGRPAFIPNRDGHGAWVNSRALEMAGITATTADPSDGRIEREADGSPQGMLHEGAMEMVRRILPPTTQADWERGVLAGQAYLHRLGITAWQDAIVGGPYDTLDAYVAVHRRGELTARVVAALWWDRERGLEQIPDLVERRAQAPDGRLRATSIKIMQDGVTENFTAAVLEPYLDGSGRPTDNRGISFVPPELLDEAVTRLDREGFQVHFHSLAERAVREALDAFEAALGANGPNDHRHHIAHVQIVHPDDLPRFAALGVTANIQPLWATLEGQMVDLTMPFLGEERSGWQYPFASLARAGARLAAGSDWSVTSPDPLWQMAVAVHRRHPTGRSDAPRALAETFLPHERLTLDQALHAFTMGSAYVNHLDHVTGSLEVGKSADLAVIDRDLTHQDLDGLGHAIVELTLVDGRPVHASGAFEGLEVP